MNDRVSQLAHCLQIIEEADDVERCAELYPDLRDELHAYEGAITTLAKARPPESSASGQLLSRQVVLSALNQRTSLRPRVRGFITRGAGGIAMLVLLVAGAAGAAASTSGGMREMGPVSEVLAAVGLIEKESSDSGGDLRQTPEPQSQQEESVPPPAQNVSPQDEPGLEGQAEQGAGVAEDVHEAIETTEPGPERGVAASEAACESAYDPERLPDAAAEAHENQNKEPKDCSHPNADGTPGNGNRSAPEKELGKPEQAPGGPPPDKPTGGGPPGGSPPDQNKKP